MPGPEVSVVIPAYNHQPYLRQAVESVLGQSCHDLELIVIDDASQDGTWDVLAEFDDPRIRLLRHQVNAGAHATLNEGLGLSRGEYVAILNSDDLFDPERIGACVAHLASQQADLVGTDIRLIDADGNQMTEHWWTRNLDELKSAWRETNDWVATLLAGNMFMSTSNFVFRRDLYTDLGGFGDYRYVHDYEWLLRALAAGRRLAWLDRPLLSYRLHAHNTLLSEPLAGNRECSRMLRARLPELIGGSRVIQARVSHLAKNWEHLDAWVQHNETVLRLEAVRATEDALLPMIADRDRWIRDRDGWVADRDRWIADRDRWIEDRDGWIADRDQQVRQLLAEVAASRTALDKIATSWIWRITGPLRTAADALRGTVRSRS